MKRSSVSSSSSVPGGRPDAAEQVHHLVGEVRVEQVGHRQVDRDRQLPALGDPRGALPRRLLEDHRRQQRHEATALDLVEEAAGRHEPGLRVLPAGQRLDAGHLAGTQRDLRLVVHDDLAAAGSPGAAVPSSPAASGWPGAGRC